MDSRWSIFASKFLKAVGFLSDVIVQLSSAAVSWELCVSRVLQCCRILHSPAVSAEYRNCKLQWRNTTRILLTYEHACQVSAVAPSSLPTLIQSLFPTKNWRYWSSSRINEFAQSRTDKMAGFVYRLTETSKIDIKIKVGWVSKNSGNSLCDGHWDIWILTMVSWDK